MICLFSVAGCSSRKEATLLENLSKNLHSESIEKFRSVRSVNDNDFQIKPSLYLKFEVLDSIYNETRSLIEDKTQNEIQQFVDKFSAIACSMVSEIYNPKYKPNPIPENNSILFAKIELAMLTNEIVVELVGKIGAEDVKFDQLRAFVEHSKNSIKLGDKILGRVYLSAISSAPNQKLVFFLNGDTLKTDSYFADFNYTPKTRGIKELNFEVKSNMKSWLSNIEISNQVIKVEVK